MEHQDFQRLEEKLDRVLTILHGDGGREMGMVQKVNILWLLVMKWPLYLASIILGGAITVVIQRVFR